MLKEPPAEIMTLIDTALSAFNRKDSALFCSIFGGDVVIVDGFAPFRWIGPGAETRWWADGEAWGKAGGVAKEHISLERTWCCEISDARAYASLSATLTITLNKGEPIVRPGTLVYTFAKQGNVWRAEGQMWGRLN